MPLERVRRLEKIGLMTDAGRKVLSDMNAPFVIDEDMIELINSDKELHDNFYSFPKLTPTAEFESNYIALDILNLFNTKIKYPVIPNLVFALPRIGQVGVSIKEVMEHPELYRVEKVELGKTMTWLNKNQRYEEVTFIIDKKKHLVGASIISDDAGAYLDVLTLIINLKVGVGKLSKMIFSFPTQTYGLISSLVPLMLKQ